MKYEQIEMDLSLDHTNNNINFDSDYFLHNFSHNHIAPESERQKLEKKYIRIVEVTDKFNRRIVSYQANKEESIHKWIKYKEGFSSSLVKTLIDEFGLSQGDTLLDPFLGSGTSSLTANTLGINSIGIDILPISHIATQAKSFVYDYNLKELGQVYQEIEKLVPKDIGKHFNHLAITKGAFPKTTEQNLLFFTDWNNNSSYSHETKTLIKLILTSILEEVSYTRKDGQYLRWDYRSSKVIESNKKRALKGKPPIKTVLDKGKLPTVKESLLSALGIIIKDIKSIQMQQSKVPSHKLIKESALSALPKIEDDTIDGVITSPPYCNRYDYTRTYALELAYLGVDEKKIRQLRQAQLSCTVENKSKLEQLEDYYQRLGLEKRYEKIHKVIKENSVLNEVNQALYLRNTNGEVNQ